MGRGKGRGKGGGTPRPRKSRKKTENLMSFPLPPPQENMNVPPDVVGMMPPMMQHDEGSMSMQGMPVLEPEQPHSLVEPNVSAETSVFNFTEDEEPPPPLHPRDVDGSGKKPKTPR